MPARRDLANAIRALAMDAVQKANSGHPGMPMGMADIAEVVWNDFLRHNPANPAWPDRDRFVLSNGHGSMLQYACLHLSGYELPMSELERFRQLRSMTPGHPERGVTPGVETTTGPLGQGLANAVGMAIAERALAARFNRDGHTVVDHHVYVFAGDGCLMEGISHEACSLAGTLGLGKLIVLYDDNGISIDGQVRGWFTDDTAARFRAYGWQVLDHIDGQDASAVASALGAARADRTRPSLLMCRTTIGFGAPRKGGTAAAHGSPLGEEEVAAAREALGWTHPPFVIPEEIYGAWNATREGARLEREWQDRFDAYTKTHPELAAELRRRMDGDLPEGFAETAAQFVREVHAKGETIASRKASHNTIAAFARALPELFGGSADLTGSNLTDWAGASTFDAQHAEGDYLHYGVREFAMFAIANGIAAHGGFLPFSGTFLVFSDYARNALRLAALMGLRSIAVLTHDSIGLGEDGPTHQPVEHAASLRLIPNLHVWRPCDTVETALAWRAAAQRAEGPTCLLLSRQNLEHQARSDAQVEAIGRGGYTLLEPEEPPEALLLATGSEVQIAMHAARTAAERGIPVRVVSMPCAEVFDAQPATYRDAVLPPAITARVAVEAGASAGWFRYVGTSGRVVGIDRFGESAPPGQVYEYLGITAARVLAAIETVREEATGGRARTIDAGA